MSNPMTRRSFIRSGAAVGAGVLLSPKAFAAGTRAASKDAINVGLIGGGAQGQVLMDSVIKISKDSPVHFQAICDIWEPNRDRVRKTFKAYRRYGHKDHAYVDYQEMLDKEDLDAVIVATPDFWHHKHAMDAMDKGLHVYSEKEMSNTLENARAMVLKTDDNLICFETEHLTLVRVGDLQHGRCCICLGRSLYGECHGIHRSIPRSVVRAGMYRVLAGGDCNVRVPNVGALGVLPVDIIG